MDVCLDCGELLPGHRFLITGLRHDGQSDDRLHCDFTGHAEGQSGEPMMAVTYEVRPGLSESESSLYVYAEVVSADANGSVLAGDVQRWRQRG